MKSLNQFARRYVSFVCAIALIATSLAHGGVATRAAKRAITHMIMTTGTDPEPRYRVMENSVYA
jgi:hypothetical protein